MDDVCGELSAVVCFHLLASWRFSFHICSHHMTLTPLSQLTSLFILSSTTYLQPISLATLFKCIVYMKKLAPYYIQTQHDSRFYELKITIPESYPATPPKVRFVSKINMNCVDPNNGEIIYSKVPATKNWNRNMGMEQVLISLRAEMASGENRRTKQPPEGSTF